MTILKQFGLSDQKEEYIFLKFLELILQLNLQELIANHVEDISSLFEKVLSYSEEHFSTPFSFNCFYQLLKLLKKLINILEIFPEKIQANLFTRIININLGVIQHLEKYKTQTMVMEVFIQESSEILTRFALQNQT